MSAEARYFRVGLFVLLGIAAIAAAVVVLAGGDLFARPILMETYFDEAVTGPRSAHPSRSAACRSARCPGSVSWTTSTSSRRTTSGAATRSWC